MKPGEMALAEPIASIPIEFALQWMRTCLFHPFAVREDEYVVFGSTVLYLHGIREAHTVGDLDVFLHPRVWGALLGQHLTEKSGMTVETPRAGDPPFLEYKLRTPIHFFYAWTDRDQAWMNVADCFASRETVNGWSCISLGLLRKHKMLAHSHNLGSKEHEKHARDLALIDQHLDVYPDGAVAWPSSY